MIIVINRDKEEELERERGLRKDLEQRLKVRDNYYGFYFVKVAENYCYSSEQHVTTAEISYLQQPV